MRNEAPIITKALRLASVVVLVAVVALAASVGYSAYQEYRVLGSVFSSRQNIQQQANSSQVSETVSGNQLSLSGITIPNNMTYPLDLELSGNVSLDGVLVSSFASPLQTIMHGQVGQVQLGATLNFSSFLANATALESVLLNSENMSTYLTIYAGIDPVAGLNVTNTSNSTIGPVLGQLTVSAGSPYQSSNGAYILPVQLSWQNDSPLQFGASVTGILTQIPGQPTGNYGTASNEINMTQGSNQDTLNFQIPAGDYNPQNTHGQYAFSITISAYGANVTIPETVTN